MKRPLIMMIIICMMSGSLYATQDSVVLGISEFQESELAYYPPVRKPFYYVPPRYVFRGVSYNMETEWGMPSQVFEFFAMLKEQHVLIDEKTQNLIDSLVNRLIRQNKLMTVGGIMMITGTVMTWLPLNLNSIEDTPDWAIGTSIGGMTINLAGLGVWVSQLFVHNNHYLKEIAQAFNASR